MLNFFRLLEDRIRFKCERWHWEKDKKAWREKHKIAPPAPDIVVTFLIPIFQKSRAPDWAAVSTLLQRTLGALRRQTDPRWRAVICSQDRPDWLTEDGRVSFLPYQVSHGGKNDKDHKIRHVARTLARTEKRDNYVFFLDGDDLPHPELVEFILRDNNGVGYSLPRGYSCDVQRKEVYVHGPEVNYLFTKLCGSSHAVRFDTRRDTEQVLHIALSGMHRYTRVNMRDRLAMDLGEVPFPGMLYLFNHGTSDQDVRTHQNRKMDLVSLSKAEARRTLKHFEPSLASLI